MKDKGDCQGKRKRGGEGLMKEWRGRGREREGGRM